MKNESSALRYMNEAGQAVEGDAAQAFLQNKLRKPMHGRYTQEQIDRLEQSGGPAVVNASDGAIPAGDYYDSQNPSKSGGEGAITSGKAGMLSAEEIRNKFGLDFDEKHSQGSGKGGDEDSGAIYNEDTGEYIGTIGGYSRNDEGRKSQDGDGYLREDDGVMKLKKIQDYGVDNSLTKERSNWNSINDVAGAATDIMGEVKREAAKPEEENKPIEHSPELKQAVQRVRTYENDVMSGKISDDIFGGASSQGDYSFDHNKGSTGIGTSGGNAAADSSSKATQSFLDSKKTDVKKAYNFKPA